MDGEDATGGDGPTEDGGTAFGWWPSRWSAARTAAGKVSRSGLLTEAGAVYWCESRPEDGRQVVVRATPGSAPEDVSPPGVSVRSRVHEYGGGSVVVGGGVLAYVDQSDQQWYRVGPEGEPVRLTAGDEDGWTTRYADAAVSPSGSWLLSVEERHRDARTDHRLVAVALGGPTAPPRPVVPLFDGSDFVAAPRPSPDGRWLAWVTWDHPAMPWDRSGLWVARLRESDGAIRLEGGRMVAGGDSSVGQPRWARDGSLLVMDDRTGWWLPYRLAAADVGGGGAGPRPLAAVEAEFHAPDWVLGQSTLAERSDGSLVARMHRDGRDQVVLLRPDPATGGGPSEAPWSLEVIDQPCVAVAGLVVTAGPDERLVVLGSTPGEAHGVLQIPWVGDGGTRRISSPPTAPVGPADLSEARPFTASTPEGPVPGLYYAPAGAPDGADGGPPPLVVFCHGGPTSAADGGLDPVVQFFTSRGLAVAAVNYRGSSGFGREYRQRLEGRWGEADIDDCVGYASALAREGLADGARMAIRGSSAGGLTALGALIRADRFVGAASWYGVTDLEALAADTHDFESRYVDSLVGPWPEDRAVYQARSPIHHADRVTGSVLLLQGMDDPVVPPDQSERFAATLAEHGVPCRLVLFEGESHGFRQAATIQAALRAELDFYRSLFGRGTGGNGASRASLGPAV
jgi:dipeptidyl aminopeptidase/acylaminoacyl peptidase